VKNIPRQKGFTLFEVLIVLAFMAVIGAVGLGYYLNYYRQTILKTTIDEVTAFLYETQQKSIGQQDSSQWGVHFENPSGDAAPFYTSFKGSTYSTSVDKKFLDNALDFVYPADGQNVDIIFNKINGKVSDGQFKKIYIQLKPGVATKAVKISPAGVLSKDDGEVGWWKFDEGTGTIAADSSGYGNKGTVSGATWATEGSCKSEACLSFDGVDDYVDTSLNLSGTSDYTTTLWMNVSSSFPNDKYNRFLGTQSWGVGRLGMIMNPGATYNLNTYFGTGYDYWLQSGVTLPKDTWVYLTATFDRNGLQKVYYNGKEKASIDMAPAQTINWVNESFRIACGVNGSTYQPHKGYIDDVRIYDRVLTADEIKELYETTR
jgi:prepilin-type N-terminal cleavage/methylation domain-containing protein